MDSAVSVLPEPILEFRHHQGLVDPHDGLAMFGPYDGDLPSEPGSISYGVIGTPAGIAAFGAWSQLMKKAIPTERGLDRRLWPTFPGFEAVFACEWPTQPTWVVDLNEAGLVDASRNLDPNKRAAAVVEQYLDGIQRLHRRDDSFGVIVCVVPEIVYKNCRPKSRVRHGIGDLVSGRTRRERARAKQQRAE